jgi:glycosyltransferase involved in cell wall biosynthesis
LQREDFYETVIVSNPSYGVTEMNGPGPQRADRLRVLLSAYACEPERGSEPGVGWNWANQIGRLEEVWVITRANNRPAIESVLSKERLPNVHFIYFDLPRWARFWKRGRRRIHAYYYLWQIGAYLVARKLHRQVGFDLVHHITFVNYWMPSFMALLPVPFLWGPVGGGESAPRAFWPSFSLRGKVHELVRDIVRRSGRLDPFVRLTARRAAFALTTTEETYRRVRALGCGRALVYPESGLSKEEIHRLANCPRRHCTPFRVASIGDLLHLKAFDLGLRAFALFEHQFPASEYWLIGEGPERKRLEALAQRLGVAPKVTFCGRKPRSEVLEKLADCDVLLHPSLHDSGGWVCLEAMAAGRPVICLNLGGPGFQVNDETGIKVPAVTPQQAVRDIAAALCQLASEPKLRWRLGEAGRRRVDEHFNWDLKGRKMAEIYRLARESPAPLEQVQGVD